MFMILAPRVSPTGPPKYSSIRDAEKDHKSTPDRAPEKAEEADDVDDVDDIDESDDTIESAQPEEQPSA
jgi:hypothetical protein